jgi:hypothetical protein
MNDGFHDRRLHTLEWFLTASDDDVLQALTEDRSLFETLRADLARRHDAEPDCVESYRVEPDKTNAGADWHTLTFASGRQIMIYTDRPLVIVDPEQH